MADDFIEHLRKKLEAALAPSLLEIKDDSARHKGHAGTRPGGESHFQVRLVSAMFEGLAPLARHRLVYTALGDEMKGKIHALNIEALTLQEYNHKYN